MKKPNIKNLRKLITITEASKIIGVSSVTLRRWDKEGKLKAIQHPFNRYRLYDKKDLYEFLNKLKKKEEYAKQS